MSRDWLKLQRPHPRRLLMGVHIPVGRDPLSLAVRLVSCRRRCCSLPEPPSQMPSRLALF